MATRKDCQTFSRAMSSRGPIAVTICLAIACFFLWRANRRQEVEPEETISEHPVFGPAAERAAPPTPVAA